MEALKKVSSIGITNDFPERKIDEAIRDIMGRVKECSNTAHINSWEIFFVGSGSYFLPEMTLLHALLRQRIRVNKINFIDKSYHDGMENIASTAISESLQLISNATNKPEVSVNCYFPTDTTWRTEGRMVIAFSKLIHWASIPTSNSNIPYFLTNNWTYVQANCKKKRVAFIDAFLHIDNDQQLVISDFSDVTQPPLTDDSKHVNYIGTTWRKTWKEYVTLMLHPALRGYVKDMMPSETYDIYCAKYSIVTPNDAKRFAVDICDMCRQKQGMKRKTIDSIAVL